MSPDPRLRPVTNEDRKRLNLPHQITHIFDAVERDVMPAVLTARPLLPKSAHSDFGELNMDIFQ